MLEAHNWRVGSGGRGMSEWQGRQQCSPSRRLRLQEMVEGRRGARALAGRLGMANCRIWGD